MTDKVFQPSKSLAEAIVKKYGTPVFVTDQKVLEDRVHQFKNAFSFGAKIYFAVKANFNPHILAALKQAGVDGIDTVSPYEIKWQRKRDSRVHRLFSRETVPAMRSWKRLFVKK
jgi:diaminopimelate decarboxylase